MDGPHSLHYTGIFVDVSSTYHEGITTTRLSVSGVFFNDSEIQMGKVLTALLDIFDGDPAVSHPHDLRWVHKLDRHSALAPTTDLDRTESMEETHHSHEAVANSGRPSRLLLLVYRSTITGETQFNTAEYRCLAQGEILPLPVSSQRLHVLSTCL